MQALPHLHDASLLRACLVWGQEAKVELLFRMAGPRHVRLVGTKASLLSCPHRNPWGASISVNEVRGPIAIADGYMQLEVEMQSGDTLVVEAEGFSWSESESTE
jgi:hypothetical protein